MTSSNSPYALGGAIGYESFWCGHLGSLGTFPKNLLYTRVIRKVPQGGRGPWV